MLWYKDKSKTWGINSTQQLCLFFSISETNDWEFVGWVDCNWLNARKPKPKHAITWRRNATNAIPNGLQSFCTQADAISTPKIQFQFYQTSNSKYKQLNESTVCHFLHHRYSGRRLQNGQATPIEQTGHSNMHLLLRQWTHALSWHKWPTILGNWKFFEAIVFFNLFAISVQINLQQNNTKT